MRESAALVYRWRLAARILFLGSEHVRPTELPRRKLLRGLVASRTRHPRSFTKPQRGSNRETSQNAGLVAIQWSFVRFSCATNVARTLDRTGAVMKRWAWELLYRGRPTWELGGPDPSLLSALDTFDVRPGRVLDLGCGTGDNAIALAQQGFDVVAIDISDRAISQARAKAREADCSVDFAVGSVVDLDGVTGPFDLFVDRGCLHSLSGSDDRDALAANMKRLAADGCHAYVAGFVPMGGMPSPARLLAERGILNLSAGEVAKRFAPEFDVHIFAEVAEKVKPPTSFLLGRNSVTLVSYWLTRQDSRTSAAELDPNRRIP